MAAAKLVPDETTLAGLAKALENVIHVDLATRRACELEPTKRAEAAAPRFGCSAGCLSSRPCAHRPAVSNC